MQVVLVLVKYKWYKYWQKKSIKSKHIHAMAPLRALYVSIIHLL